MIIKKSAATQRRQQVENILRPLQHLINERCVPKKNSIQLSTFPQTRWASRNVVKSVGTSAERAAIRFQIALAP